MRKKYFIFILVLSISCLRNVSAQEGFQFYKQSQKHEDLRFKLINNLIVIPLEVNGKSLNFILDTGVNKTIVFNSAQSDSIFYIQSTIYKLRGLGNGKPVDAIISSNNTFRIKNLISKNQKVYIILKDEFDLSSKMGITIHGVVGYDILKNLILRINYRNKKIRFFNPKTFKYKKCKKCEAFPLTIYRNKPYLNAEVTIDENSNTKIPVKMLVDSGGSDAIWLFEDSKEGIVTPEKHFDDFLGVGLNGTIYGKRSRIASLTIGSFKIPRPTVSFLDTISTKEARRYKGRNGTIGSNILKRFKVWIDYPNAKIVLKKNASFTGGFNYNMSGIEVVYNGKALVSVPLSKILDGYGRDLGKTSSQSISIVTSYVYQFKPSFRINEVIKDSPADIAGAKKGDIILEINGKPTHSLNLSKIISKFQEKNNKLIRLTLQRDFKKIKVQFRLKKLI